jgi:transcriptional regulator with XRE-family HTH domain
LTFSAPSAVGHWEQSRRLVPRLQLLELDRVLGAGGALADLVFALRTPKTIAARHRWYHNYDTSGGPVWAWLRTETSEPSSARIQWGPYRLYLPAIDTLTGTIINAPVSVDNPPTLVELSTPGWVDFGRGNVPESLAIPVIAGPDLLTIDDAHNETIGVVADHLRQLLDRFGRTEYDLAAFLGLRPKLVAEVLGRAGQRALVETIDARRTVADIDRARLGDRLIAIRKGRGITQREVSRLLCNLPGVDELPPVTDYHIRSIESDRQPRVEHLISRLDLLYRCGLLTDEPVGGAMAGPSEVIFPNFWVGPVWVTVEPYAASTVEVELRWGRYRRPLLVHGLTTVSFRKSRPGQEAVEINVPANCGWRAGIGDHPEAVDINANWMHVDEIAQRAIVAELLQRLLDLAGRDLRSFQQFLETGKTPESE